MTIPTLRPKVGVECPPHSGKVWVVMEGSYDGQQVVYIASTTEAAEGWAETRELDNTRRDPSTRYDVWVEEWNVDGDDFGEAH